jgi:curli biogenesis system outer membrane secretion channel CsgG
VTLRLHRAPLLALALVIAAFAVPAASATATQFPTARQIAQHEGRLGAPSTAVHFPTARQIAQHQGTAGAPSTQASVQFPTARQVAMHEGTLSAPSSRLTETRVASNPGFDWADAGVGAGAALLLVAALLYGAFIVSNRRRRGIRRATTA